AIQSLKDKVGFSDALMDLMKIGHTSGLDLSFGILIASSMIFDLIKDGKILDHVMRHFSINL
ncbi:MAG: hypothetical protein DRN49_05755, partial [Thaumarchaeota archaeon]